MQISNLELTDLVDEKVYSLIEREYLPNRKVFAAVWNNIRFEVIYAEVEKKRPAKTEDQPIPQKEIEAIVSECAHCFLYRLKAMMAAGDI